MFLDVTIVRVPELVSRSPLDAQRLYVVYGYTVYIYMLKYIVTFFIVVVYCCMSVHYVHYIVQQSAPVCYSKETNAHHYNTNDIFFAIVVTRPTVSSS